jgi:hypothetical protein
MITARWFHNDAPHDPLRIQNHRSVFVSTDPREIRLTRDLKVARIASG